MEEVREAARREVYLGAYANESRSLAQACGLGGCRADDQQSRCMAGRPAWLKRIGIVPRQSGKLASSCESHTWTEGVHQRSVSPFAFCTIA